MKKRILLLLLAQFPIAADAHAQTGSLATADAYVNPVFAGDHPDPSILRDGEDYYVVHSSFEYYPGLLIWHSTDLIDWEPVTHALHTYVGSVWAPDLVKHDGRYFIYFPANNTNYVVSADSIQGPWSEPIDLEVGNIDPGHVTGRDGQRYLYFSSGGYVPLSPDGSSVTGELRHAYDGWPVPREWSIECFCMEGPKLMEHGGYYYLTTAQGGTAGPPTGHMVISARSRSPLGPWENSPHNPILRTTDRSATWWSVGHGTPFEGPDGDWWLIFHGYEKDHYNMGRQTLLAPLEWTDDGWFRVPDGVELDRPIELPAGASAAGPRDLSDGFDGPGLRPQWQFFGEYDPHRFRLEGGSLVVEAKGGSVGDSSPLLVMPRDHSYAAEVELHVEGDAVGGLVFFYDDRAYSGILADRSDVLANLRGWQFPTEEGAVDEGRVHLRVENRDGIVDMYYSRDGSEWTKIRSSLEVSGLHHNVLGGFMSLRLGLAAVGEGRVVFDDFRYTPLAEPATGQTSRAADDRIRVMGRHRVANGAVEFGAPGVTFFIEFRGTGVDAELETTTAGPHDHDWFTVVVDGAEPVRFRADPGRRWYALADDLAPGEHTLALSKATEGQNGHDRLVAVRTGELLEAEPLPARRLEFIGNSITAGYGLDAREIACDDGTWYDQTHAWLAYGPRLARRLDAQWMLTAVSGMGMHRNWNSPGPVMPDVYEDVYLEYDVDITPWSFDRYTPDLVLIALGTNDFSRGGGEEPRPDLDGEAFVDDYTGFVGTVRDRYPDARILLVDSPTLAPTEKTLLSGYLRQVVERRAAAGDGGIDTFSYEGRYASGCDGHPDLEEHVAMADELEPAIRALMGWRRSPERRQSLPTDHSPATRMPR
jgi:xylan 1,4-beta-xylosidase